MSNLDTSLFFGLYGLAGHSSVVDLLIVFFGKYYIFVSLLVLAYFLYRDWEENRLHRWKLYVFAVAAGIFALYGVRAFIHLFIHRPRPFLALSLPHLITDATFSFPSGHTIFMFSLATVVYFFNRKLAYFLYASGLIIGLARVAGGVHYPSDILGGILLGIATGTGLYGLFKLLRPQLLKSN